MQIRRSRRCDRVPTSSTSGEASHINETERTCRTSTANIAKKLGIETKSMNTKLYASISSLAIEDTLKSIRRLIEEGVISAHPFWKHISKLSIDIN